MYKDSTVYIVGHGKTSSDNAITSNFKIFFIGFVIDTQTDLVADLECSATIDITNRFVHDLFLGKSFSQYDPEVEKELARRYFGSSQKAIITAYKDAIKKYTEVKEKYYQTALFK
ncbi:DUF3870 domain-containing protein [Anaerovorax odorimutans]|uniref:DUF3870 domain-containing protein n=1 Tax=Anaerovorax odorimutans TaxID=109327 RepID=A0ABT1RJZ5_9FIRM|nr:DUF3870 domain-containing protein [Anaerovorax odorimutans]MCQ4635511.1 DUF3870 domain-containing protein [Anaerovorax odorimutans]